ncbi:MAG: hypothetical protein HY842_12340 [Bacteroidetes bacterium]|nr:hypothetical protein [Bacteroidota bacterium]
MKNFNRFFSTSKLFLMTVSFGFCAAGQLELSAQNAITVSTERMNTLFIGVTNHLNITVDGIPDEQVYLASDAVEIEKIGKGLFNVTATNPGRVTLTVHGDGAFQYKNFEFDVQRLPDPLAVLHLEGGEVKMDGEMAPEQFKKATGLGFQLPGNALEITSFNLTRVPKMGDPVEVPNGSADFNQRTKKLVNEAVPGDRYYFQVVMAKMAGTTEQRQLNSLLFRIK